MKNKFFQLAIVVILTTSIMSSCMVTKTPVGTYKQETGQVYRYAKGKQVWLFWGLIPCGRTSVATPTDGSCMVKTGYGFGDVLISVLTGGIVSTYSIKVYDKKQESNPNSTNEK
jgi:hypothetical protein